MSPLTIWWPVCLHRKFWSLNYLVVPYSCTREAFPCGESLFALYGTCVLWKSFFCLWSFCSGSFGNRLTTKTSFPNFASSLLNRRQWSENLFFAHHIGFFFAKPLSQCLVNKALLKHRRAHRIFGYQNQTRINPIPTWSRFYIFCIRQFCLWHGQPTFAGTNNGTMKLGDLLVLDISYMSEVVSKKESKCLYWTSRKCRKY